MADKWEMCVFDDYNFRVEFYNETGSTTYDENDYWLKFIGTNDDWRKVKENYRNNKSKAIICKLLTDGWEPYAVVATDRVKCKSFRRKVSS
jgi:hypothetical protein